jgi:hypothetical protein
VRALDSYASPVNVALLRALVSVLHPALVEDVGTDEGAIEKRVRE